MAPQRKGSVAWCVGFLACAATVTSVTWLTTLVAAQHSEGVLPDSTLHSRHSLLDLERPSIAEHIDSRAEMPAAHDPGSKSQGSAVKLNSQEKASTGEKVIKKKLSEQWLANSNKAFKEGIDKKEEPKDCNIQLNTDLALGDAVAWGPDNKKNLAEECCTSCKEYNEKVKASERTGPLCKFWVWCGDKERCGRDYGACWLKTLVHMDSLAPTRGNSIPWTAGILPEFDPSKAIYEEVSHHLPERSSLSKAHKCCTAFWGDYYCYVKDYIKRYDRGQVARLE